MLRSIPPIGGISRRTGSTTGSVMLYTILPIDVENVGSNQLMSARANKIMEKMLRREMSSSAMRVRDFLVWRGIASNGILQLSIANRGHSRPKSHIPELL